MRTLVILMITIYVPLAGGINGDKYAANQTEVKTGHCACGYKYDFGTMFVLPGSVVDYTGTRDFVCIDRGGMITNNNLDLALVSQHTRLDLKTAFRFGKRKMMVEVWESGAKLKQFRRQMELIE